MKTLMKTRVYLALAAVFVTLTLVGPAAAQKPMHFHGSIQGEETAAFNADGSIRTVDGSGTGRSTEPHLRRFSVQWGVKVIVATGRSTGHYTFKAADGDSISTELIGYGEAIFPQPGPPTPYSYCGTQRHYWRYRSIRRGATGSFTLDRLVDVSTDPNPLSEGPFSTSGSFHGTITSRGAED
jgi:hypothetical protein